MSLYMMIATLAFGLMTFGVVLKKKRGTHGILMTSAIVLDLGLVLFLQITRDAVQTAVSFELNQFQQIHILTSTIAVVLYIPAWLMPWFDKVKKWHPYIGVMAYFFRTIGFVFMFSHLK